MPTVSERELIERAIAGDRNAFRGIVEKHQAFIRSLSCRFVGNTAEAEDITQEAFIRLWKNLSKYRFEVKLTTWLYKIVSNLCLDYLRSRHGKRRRLTTSVEDHHQLPEASTADQKMLDEEFMAVVLTMKEGLTPKQKAVFILRDLEELSMEEISEVLSMSAGNVKSNLYHARVKMSTLINTYYSTIKTEPI